MRVPNEGDLQERVESTAAVNTTWIAPAGDRRGRGFAALASLPLLTSLGILYAAYRSSHPFLERYFIADLLYLPTVFSDLATGGSLDQWYLTPAPYFFPDFLEYLVAYPLGSDTLGRAAVFSVLQLLLLFGLTVYLSRGLRTRPASGVFAGSVVVVALSWFALRDHDFRAAAFALIGTIHFGTFLSALLLAALWVANPRPRLARLVVVGALCAAAALSDTLFVVQAALPFVVATLMVHLRSGALRGAAIRAMAVVGIASGAGLVAYHGIVAHDTRPDGALALADAEPRLQSVASEVASMVISDPLVVAVFVLYLAVSVRVLVRMRSTDDAGDLRLAWLVIYSAVSMAAAPVTVALLPSLAVTSRYFIPVAGWPIVVVASAALNRPSVPVIRSVTAFLVVALASMAINVGAARSSNAAYPRDVACIDRALSPNGARYGIAGYWDAKPIQIQSKANIVIAQYTSDLHERRWLTTSRYFRSHYDFAIVDNDGADDSFSAATLLHYAPSPRQVVTCGTRQVFWYGANGLNTWQFPATGR